MKMAKANSADLDMAMQLCSALDCLTSRWPTVPSAVEKIDGTRESEDFDRDDPEQCERVLGHIIDLAGGASLMRVVFGCAVMLDPRNQCVDPAADTIEHHPAAKAGLEAQKPQPLETWHEDHGEVLWWKFPLDEPPWCGTPLAENWPHYHTHWTPLIVPIAPAVEAIETSA